VALDQVSARVYRSPLQYLHYYEISYHFLLHIYRLAHVCNWTATLCINRHIQICISLYYISTSRYLMPFTFQNTGHLCQLTKTRYNTQTWSTCMAISLTVIDHPSYESHQWSIASCNYTVEDVNGRIDSSPSNPLSTRQVFINKDDNFHNESLHDKEENTATMRERLSDSLGNNSSRSAALLSIHSEIRPKGMMMVELWGMLKNTFEHTTHWYKQTTDQCQQTTYLIRVNHIHCREPIQ